MKTLRTIANCHAITDMNEVGAEIARIGSIITSGQKKLNGQKESQWPITVATVIRCETGFDMIQEEGKATVIIPTASTNDEFLQEYRAFLEAVLPEEVLASIKKDKTGEYCFRSDPATKNCWAFASSIGRAIAAGVSYEDMFNDPENDGKIPSKGFIEGLTKARKANIDKLKPLLETCKTICEGMAGDSPADIREAQDLVSELLGIIGMVS